MKPEKFIATRKASELKEGSARLQIMDTLGLIGEVCAAAIVS